MDTPCENFAYTTTVSWEEFLQRDLNPKPLYQHKSINLHCLLRGIPPEIFEPKASVSIEEYQPVLSLERNSSREI